MKSIGIIFTLTFFGVTTGFMSPSSLSYKKVVQTLPTKETRINPISYPTTLARRESFILRDILGLGPAEIALTLIVGLVLFGPETLKSLSKDVGRAAAELKELPKTFKEGMEEGAESNQVSKMKAIAAEKRKKRDAKVAAAASEDDDDDDDDA